MLRCSKFGSSGFVIVQSTKVVNHTIKSVHCSVHLGRQLSEPYSRHIQDLPGCRERQDMQMSGCRMYWTATRASRSITTDQIHMYTIAFLVTRHLGYHGISVEICRLTCVPGLPTAIPPQSSETKQQEHTPPPRGLNAPISHLLGCKLCAEHRAGH